MFETEKAAEIGTHFVEKLYLRSRLDHIERTLQR